MFELCLLGSHLFKHGFNLVQLSVSFVVLLFDQVVDVDTLLAPSPELIGQAQALEEAPDDSHSNASDISFFPTGSRLCQVKSILHQRVVVVLHLM